MREHEGAQEAAEIRALYEARHGTTEEGGRASDLRANDVMLRLPPKEADAFENESTMV